MDISLEGKVAIVTEVGLNIGSGIALAFARYGAKVACTYFDLDAAKAARRLQLRHRQRPRQALVLPASG